MILARWQSCQSVNELNRKNQWTFFKIEGFVGKRSLLSSPPPPSFHLFALAPFFVRLEWLLWRPEFRSLRTGTLATQATSWHVLLKTRVSGTNYQHLLWKNDDYSKTERENGKNRRHSFQGKLSDNELAKFQLNRFRGCRLGVKHVRLTFRNFRSEKTRKIYFLRHLTRNRIITPNHPSWCLPERDHRAITIGVWQVICSRPMHDLSRTPPCFFPCDGQLSFWHWNFVNFP